jgi:hypothetical protein
MDPTLIAACGMNCNVCLGHLREKNRCPGCTKFPLTKKTRLNCKLRICTQRSGRFCFSCEEFPCQRLKSLDKRYRTRFAMSEIENLENIRDNGLENFMKSQEKKYIHGNCVFCVHNGKLYPKVVE